MSIRKRLLLSNMMMILMPLLLFALSLLLLAGFVFKDFGSAIGLAAGNKPEGNPFAQIRSLFAGRSELTSGITYVAKYDPDLLAKETFLADMEQQLSLVKSGIAVMKQSEVVYVSPSLQENGLYKELLTQSAAGVHSGGSWGSWHGHGGVGHNYTLTRIPVTFVNGGAGVVLVASDMRPVVKYFSTLMPLAVFTLLLALALTNGLLTFLVSRSIVGPLSRLKHAAEEMMEGRLDRKVPVKGNDEIGKLGEAFENMRVRLGESIGLQLQYEENRKELLANISHDLKTPIAAIQGCVDCLRDGVADTEEKQRKYVGMIARKTADMDRMIDELTLYSKLDLKRLPFYFAKLDLSSFVRSAAEELQLDPRMGGVRISASCGDYERRPLMVLADVEKLQRVVANIADNALKYMKADPRSLHLTLESDGVYAVVRIRDNGPGFSPEIVPYVFDRFYRGESARGSETGGSGLGLAIVKGIVEAHGGKVWAANAAEGGAEIGFSLPVAGPDKDHEGREHV